MNIQNDYLVVDHRTASSIAAIVGESPPNSQSCTYNREREREREGGRQAERERKRERERERERERKREIERERQ